VTPGTSRSSFVLNKPASFSATSTSNSSQITSGMKPII
jgi:hypothetical protein